MRIYFLLMIFATSLLYAQVSNVRQTTENGRIIVTYDLSGSDKNIYTITVTATNENKEFITPHAIVGDLAAVMPGIGRKIWWEPQLEDLPTTSWKVDLTAQEDIGVHWIYVEGGPNGDFYISATEVTFEQYDEFCEATGHKKPDAEFGRGKQPVINVNVADAVAFCKWLSKETGTTVRLPEENEWEYAARGGNKSKGYEYSGSNSIDEVAWYENNSGNEVVWYKATSGLRTHEVGTKRPNELGIYDMSGNVWEWCGTSGVFRGGSWGCNDGNNSCRVSFRGKSSPDNLGNAVGFRVLQMTTALISQFRGLKRIISLTKIEFSSTALDQQRNEKLRQLQNPVKDEFETQAEFEKRKSESVTRANVIRAEYARRIAEAKKIFDKRKMELKSELHFLLAQTIEDVKSHFTLGTYDSERNTFNIYLYRTEQNEQNNSIKVPRELARDFKNQSSVLVAKGQKQLGEDLQWEYFNWSVTLPTGQAFTFGEQRGVSAQVAQMQSTPPPSLTATVSFSEPSGNNALNAEEKAALTLIVTNNGKGTALGLEAKISTQNTQGISSNNSLFVGEVPPGAVRTAVLEVSADDQIKDGKAVFTFTFSEARGFPPDPIKVTIDTRALVPPQFVIADVGVREPSGNGKIDNEEVVEITTRIQNIGRGNAKGVKVSFDFGQNVMKMPESASEFAVGELASGAFYDATIKAYTNKVATEIPIYVSVTEPSGRYDIKHQRLTQLQLNQHVQQLQEVVIAGKESEKGNIYISGGLSIDIEQNIPITNEKNPNAVALVIGISNYKNPDVPSVDYAKRGATMMKEYLIKTMGYDQSRILFLEDENASLADFKKVFQKLNNMVKPGKSDVFVYYNGHGAPDTKTSDAFFVPYDCDPTYANETGYPVTEFYNQLTKLDAKSITVVLDACFSGSSPKGMLFKNVSPALLRVKNPIAAIQNGVVFSSSSENQLSNWYPEKKHGLFTYFFLKGLQGAADANKDGQITAEELENYLNENVPEIAREQNHEQTPQMFGDKDRVIVRY